MKRSEEFGVGHLKQAAWLAFKHVKDDYSKSEKSIGLDKIMERQLREEFELYWADQLKQQK